MVADYKALTKWRACGYMNLLRRPLQEETAAEYQVRTASSLKTQEQRGYEH